MYQCRVDDGPANVPVSSRQQQVLDSDEKNVTLNVPVLSGRRSSQYTSVECTTVQPMYQCRVDDKQFSFELTKKINVQVQVERFTKNDE